MAGVHRLLAWAAGVSTEDRRPGLSTNHSILPAWASFDTGAGGAVIFPVPACEGLRTRTANPHSSGVSGGCPCPRVPRGRPGVWPRAKGRPQGRQRRPRSQKCLRLQRGAPARPSPGGGGSPVPTAGAWAGCREGAPHVTLPTPVCLCQSPWNKVSTRQRCLCLSLQPRPAGFSLVASSSASWWCRLQAPLDGSGWKRGPCAGVQGRFRGDPAR